MPLIILVSAAALRQTTLEYAEVGRVVDVALAAVKYGAPGADAKGYLAKVQARLSELEKVISNFYTFKYFALLALRSQLILLAGKGLCAWGHGIRFR